MVNPALAERVVEVPTALTALVAAVATGGAEAVSASQQGTAAGSALVLAKIAAATPRLAHRVAGAEGALPALVNAIAAGGGDTARNCAGALMFIAGPDPALAQRVVDVPGALPALVAAVSAGGAESASASQQDTAAISAFTLHSIASATPGLAQRVAEAEGVLHALVNAEAAGCGGIIATNCSILLGVMAGADPALAQCVAKAPGAVPALVSAKVAGGDAATTAGRALAAIRSWEHAAVAAAGAECGRCGRSADEDKGVRMRVCTGCNIARFCNTDCQRHAWGSHKMACRALAATSVGSGGA